MTDSSAEEKRAQQQHKRIKLFHAMRDSGSADVLPALQECNYPQFYQFALAMEQMLHTWAIERGARSAEDARAAAMAVLRQGRGPFAEQVLAAVEADAAHTAWPWRTTLAHDTVEPLVERLLTAPPDATPGPPCFRLRVLGPYARSCLVEVGWDFVDAARVVQRDSVYQSLVFLLGLLSRHPLLKDAASSEAALALIQHKRELARSSLQSSVERCFPIEQAEVRAQVGRARVELEALRGTGAEEERLKAEAAAVSASAAVDRCTTELDQARIDASTRAEWLALCGERQQFWTRELNRSRQREETAKTKALEATVRVSEAQTRLERLEEWLWSTTTCPFGRGSATLADHLEVTARAMSAVDAYFDAFVPMAGWVDARREHMETLRAWIQNEDVVLDGHLTAVKRSEAILRGV